MVEYKLYDDRLVPKPVGFRNHGNTCWLNSMLQLFLSLPALHSLNPIEDKKLKKSYLVGWYNNLYLELMKSTYKGLPTDDTYIDNCITQFHRAMLETVNADRNRKLRAGSQECADEWSTYFLASYDKSDDFGCLFKHCYKSQITCPSCKFCSVTRIYENKIYFPSYLNVNSEGEFVDYLKVHGTRLPSYKCEKCETVSQDIEQEFYLTMLKEIVIIVLDKFVDKKVIPFPRRMKFASSRSDQKIEYELVAQVEHSGNMTGGHYTCYAKRQDGFYLFNDSHISKEEPAPTANTFIVAYHMVPGS